MSNLKQHFTLEATCRGRKGVFYQSLYIGVIQAKARDLLAMGYNIKIEQVPYNPIKRGGKRVYLKST